jgi:two-component system chemotaxis sensor kinase CheA
VDSRESYRILLVDDERFLLTIYSAAFLKEGFDVYACTSALDGIAAIRKGFAPDVILFDITMPETSGYEFLERLGDVALPRGCHRIALTNEGQDAEIARALELGADAHVIKAGYTAHELVALVREMLHKRRA